MNDALKMQISAFVDGELPDNETELLLRRLSQDAALRQQVAGYLEIGRLLRRDKAIPGVDQLRGRIAAALGDEVPGDETAQSVVGSRLMTPTTGVAVAATVAAVALLGLSQLNAPDDPLVQQAVTIDDGPIAYTEPDIDQALAEQPSELLLQYYRSHGDSAARVGSNSALALRTTFDVTESVEVEPDPRLVPPEDDSGDETEPGIVEAAAESDTP